MRRRRAERCVLRAQVALEAGLVDEASAALEEARQLEPSLPEIASLEQRIAAVQADAATTATTHRARRVVASLAIFAVLALAAALGYNSNAWTSLRNHYNAWTSQDAAGMTPARPRRPDVALPSDPIVQSDLIAPAITLVEAAPPTTAREELPDAREPAPTPSAVVNPPQPREPAFTAAARESEPAPAPLPARRELANPGSGLTPVTLPPTPVEAATTPPPPAPPVDERTRVRAVLARYEAAYSGLDASAARQVWPGVDERALARAFEGLASQRLALGRCDVSIAGSQAHADCSGTASWTPKVGGGGRTENRRWQFELAKAGEDWQITRAIAR